MSLARALAHPDVLVTPSLECLLPRERPRIVICEQPAIKEALKWREILENSLIVFSQERLAECTAQNTELCVFTNSGTIIQEEEAAPPQAKATLVWSSSPGAAANADIISYIGKEIQVYDTIERYCAPDVQLPISVLKDILRNVDHETTKMLVFGLRHDAVIWKLAAKSCHFVEDQERWIDIAQAPIVPGDITQFHFRDFTTVADSLKDIKDERKEYIFPPEHLLATAPYDLILVQGPGGRGCH